MTVIHDEKHRNQLVLRLKRIEGQLRGIQAMILAGEDCEKVVQQISAGRRALDKTFFNVLACAIQEPATAASSARGDKPLEQAGKLLAKFG